MDTPLSPDSFTVEQTPKVSYHLFLAFPWLLPGYLYMECFSLQTVVTTSSFQDHVSVDFLQTA